MKQLKEGCELVYGFGLALCVLVVLHILHWYERIVKRNKAWSPGSHELVDTGEVNEQGRPVYKLCKR